MIIVKDNSIKTKHLELGVDDDLLLKYGSSAYVEHILRRQSSSGVQTSSTSKYDELLMAS